MINNFVGAVVKCKNSAYARDYEKYFKVISIVHYIDTQSHQIDLESMTGAAILNRTCNFSDNIGSLTWDQAFFDNYNLFDTTQVTNEPIKEELYRPDRKKFNLNDIVEYGGLHYIVISESADEWGDNTFRELTSGFIPDSSYLIQMYGKLLK